MTPGEPAFLRDARKVTRAALDDAHRAVNDHLRELGVAANFAFVGRLIHDELHEMHAESETPHNRWQ